MRLVFLEVNGFRRFRPNTAREGRVEVDGPLTSIVGPNEAGKTSLLVAMTRLDDDDAISDRDRTRLAGVAEDHLVVEAQYRLDEADRELLAGLHEGEEPLRSRWFIYSKWADGTRGGDVLPGLRRDRRPRETARRHLAAFIRRPMWVPEEHEDGSPLSLGGLERLNEILQSEAETLEDHEIAAVLDLRQSLNDLQDDEAGTLDALASDLDAAYASETGRHPNDEAAERLLARRPAFLFFDDAMRDLHTDYELSEVADTPPPALANLANLAGLNLRFLYNLVIADDTGTAVATLQDANERLDAAFSAWSQDRELSVRFDREQSTVLRIHVSNPAGGYSTLDERSDGLKIFVSLLALTATQQSEVPPIVLIDELERHLHYDAQADVVQVMSTQTVIPQIIYTTHSAGCLPEDIGAGVRLVGTNDGANHSTVENRFWSTGPGFSPLLIGMGASSLAFVPVRNAVLSEGATEVVLLPTLVREAVAVKHLGFQVAPASSEAPESHIAGLDREALKVAWVVDGDPAGDGIRRRLAAKVDTSRILQLGGEASGKVVEDLLLPAVYARAINAQLKRSGVDREFPRSRLTGVNRPRRLREWCLEHGIAEPNKVDVANRVLDLRHEEVRLLNADGLRVLRDLHTRISTLFAADDARAP